MGFNVLPTNIGGIQLPFNQLEGPLSSLFSTDNAVNLSWPSDLAVNPTMSHAVQFSVYEYTTELLGALSSGSNVMQQITNISAGDIQDITKKGLSNAQQAISSWEGAKSAGIAAADAISQYAPSAAKPFQSQFYTQRKGKFLSHISLYMPDTLVSQYDHSYARVELTKPTTIAVNAAADMASQLGSAVKGDISWANIFKSTAAKGLAGSLADSYLGTGGAITGGLGVGINPQVQLIYKGTELRTFMLSFIFTPKNSREAQTVKNIVDRFNYYALPSIDQRSSGQFLKPPQIFDIRFAFTGKSGVIGALSNIFQNAFANIGLGFLNTSNQSDEIKNAPAAKVYTIPSPCVLENVNVDYAPMGWAAYSDGHPVQIRMDLTFRETQMQTKETYGKEPGKAPDNYGSTDNGFLGPAYQGSGETAEGWAPF